MNGVQGESNKSSPPEVFWYFPKWWKFFDQILHTFCAMNGVQGESNKSSPPEVFWYFPKWWKFFDQILHTCYTFLCTLDYKFFIELTATLMKLCHIVGTSRGEPCTLVCQMFFNSF